MAAFRFALQASRSGAANQLACAELAVTGQVLILQRCIEGFEQMTEIGFAKAELASDAANRRAGATQRGDGTGTIHVGKLFPLRFKPGKTQRAVEFILLPDSKEKNKRSVDLRQSSIFWRIMIK